jgi:hypothetical protein
MVHQPIGELKPLNVELKEPKYQPAVEKLLEMIQNELRDGELKEKLIKKQIVVIFIGINGD